MKLNFIAYAGPEYQSRAKILINSINKYHSESSVILESLTNITSVGNYIPGFHRKKYRDILNMLQAGATNVVFMGSDTEIFSRMDELEFELYRNDVVVVPHVVEPVMDRNYMVQLYTTGHVNSDMVAFRNTPNAIKILQWLCNVVDDEKPYNGVFYDQTWLSSMPFLFDGVCILRHPGYNVGYWRDNMAESQLRYFHYSGYVKGDPTKISRYSNKVAVGNVLTLMEEYDRRI